MSDERKLPHEGASSTRSVEPTVTETTPATAVKRPTGFRLVVAIAVPIVIVLAGVGAFAGLVATRPQAERTDREDRGTPVRLRSLTASDEPIRVRAHGQVIAARQVVVQPELNGRIIWMNAELVPGGRLAEGDPIVRIDSRDYRSQVEQQRAQVETNRVQVTQEASRRLIAEREWQLLEQQRGATTDSGRELALREPQARQAEAALRAAQTGLRQAQTQLTRANLTAPFASFVLSEDVDVGQLVGPSTRIATLVGTDHFWVQVAVPMDELSWIRVPRGPDEEGSAAVVTQRVGESGEIRRTGRVIRLLGDLDPVGRMARVLVEIDDPLGLSRPDGDSGDASSLPMLLGAYVEVTIEAGTLEDVYRVSREVLHANDTLHVMNGENRLSIQDVEVVWRADEDVLVRGPEPGARVVVSPLPSPVDGMLLREADAAPARSAESNAPVEASGGAAESGT